MHCHSIGRRLAPAVVAALLPLQALAHAFWIQPRAFTVEEGRALPYTFEIGHGHERERSAIPVRRITQFGSVDPLGQAADLRAALARTPGQDGEVRLQVPGLHLLYLASDNGARSYLPSARFEAYLREEGLAPALAHRRASRLEGRGGSERYSRVAKVLVEAGPGCKGGQDNADRTLGLPLEIVLERSPGQRPAGSRMPVHVVYLGKPLAGGLVKLTDLDRAAAPLEAQRTDAAGNALFRMPPAGRWRLDVAWTRPVDDGGVDYETVFSSLAFERPQDACGE